MIENLKKVLPLVLLVVASLLVPANQGQIIAAVVFVWVLGWALSNRNDPAGQTFVFLTSVALVILGVASIVHMGMWQLNLWQGYLPTAMAAGISFIVSMTVNKK